MRRARRVRSNTPPAALGSGPHSAGPPPANASQSGQSFRPSDAGSPCRILIVEDDVEQRELVARWVTKAFPQAQVTATDCLVSARSAMLQDRFDLILSDLGLPDCPHEQTVSALRASCGDAPIIVLTGHAGEDSARRALQAGAEDYLVKGDVTPEVTRRAILYALERQVLKQQLLALANNDSLTGLLNRAPFRAEVERAWARAERYGDGIALLFIDIDHFKEINDTQGHEEGDRLLATVGQRLASSVRDTDRVGRLGGDEFAVLVDHISECPLEIVVERIMEAMRQPIPLETGTLYVTASVGVVRPDVSRDTLTDLFKHADAAMYQAKARGRDCYCFFDGHLHEQLRQRRRVVRRLRQAVERREFVVHYQPIVGLDNGSVVGMEALVRWDHPDEGLLPPSRFLAELEADGSIVELGRQVVREVCSVLGKHRRQRTRLSLAVNVSPAEFEVEDFVDFLRTTLDETSARPEDLKLEITESTLLGDMDHARGVLAQLAELGVDVAIDDFGTGYSSLAYLRELPVSALKIDKSFINARPDGQPDVAIVSAITQLAHALGYEVIGEGVETRDQLLALSRLHCDAWQGFLCAHPMPYEQSKAWRGRLVAP